MRIVAVKEETIQIGAPARTANISFDAMTASALAVHTDVKKNGKPLTAWATEQLAIGWAGMAADRDSEPPQERGAA